MTESRRFQAVDAVLLLLILGVAFGVRAVYLTTCTLPQYPGGWLQVQRPVSDPQKEDHELSELYLNLKDDKGFSSHTPFGDPSKVELTAHASPGYPMLLGLISRVVDKYDTLRSWICWAQAVLGTLTAGLYFLFARRAFRSLTVGTLAGLFCAVYPFWVINVAEMQDGTLASFLLALSMYFGARGIQTGGPLSSLLYGLTMAALALVRAACLPFAFIAVAWYLLRSRSVTRGWLCALLAFLGFVNGLVPWTVRNVQYFNEPVPIVDSAYYHLWIGNNPLATGGVKNNEAAEKAAIEQLDRESPDRKLASLSQQERFTRLGRLVRDFWRDDSLKAAQLRVWAALDFWFGERWFTDGDLANRTTLVVKHDEDNSESKPSLPIERAYPGILLGALLALFALAFLGWRWSYGWRRESMPAALAVIWIPLPYILSHGEALSGARLPLDGVLLCYAAFAVACMLPGVGGYLFAGSKGE